MKAQTFKRFCNIAYDRAGIRISPTKVSLVEARVAKRLRHLRIDTADEYLRFLEADATGEELVAFIDVMSTNFTHFYREPAHFELLRERVSKWVHQDGVRKLRFWCAASSTGEEPYTMAMTILDALDGCSCDVRILATDISTRVLKIAAAGCYERRQIMALPSHYRTQYFVDGEQDDEVIVTPEVRRYVVFKRLNLAKPPFPMRGPLAAVFLRNVLIYFDQPVRQRLVDAIGSLLASDGMLLIGQSENISGVKTELVPERPSVLRPAA